MICIGWLAAACLAVCALPQAWQSYRTKSSAGVSLGFLLLWLIGEILGFIYVQPRLDWPLLVNYAVNVALIVVVLRYKL